MVKLATRSLSSPKRRVTVADRASHGGAEPKDRRCSHRSLRRRVTDRDTTRLIAWSTELRDVHRRLRQALAVSRDAARDSADADRAGRDLLLYCHGFCTALDGHHHGEDRALFPAIEQSHPHLAPVLRNLERDHSMIGHLLGSLREALDRAASPGELERHLEGVAAIMENHFRYEERQLLTVLEELHLDGATGDVLGPL
jgi:hemerythrin-like domain-containing protein